MSQNKIITEKNYCFLCKHYLLNSQCDAFINQIPLEIIRGDNDHTKPLKEQENDIVFEPIKE